MKLNTYTDLLEGFWIYYICHITVLFKTRHTRIDVLKLKIVSEGKHHLNSELKSRRSEKILVNSTRQVNFLNCFHTASQLMK